MACPLCKNDRPWCDCDERDVKVYQWQQREAAATNAFIQAQADLKSAHDALAEERALADELYADLVHSGISMNRTILKYRKARGL